MEKSELITQTAQQAGVSEEEVAEIIDAFTATIKEGLVRGEKVTIAGFGTFSLAKRKGFAFANPRDQQVHEIPDRHLPHFKAGPDLQKLVEGS